MNRRGLIVIIDDDVDYVCLLQMALRQAGITNQVKVLEDAELVEEVSAIRDSYLPAAAGPARSVKAQAWRNSSSACLRAASV